MKLRELTEGLRCEIIGNPELDCLGLECDSRRVKEGYVFVAVEGTAQDGKRFVTDAISRGAICVVTEEKVNVPNHITQLIVEDTREALSRMASRINGVPSERLTMVAVTGTNGKTTVSYLVSSILEAAGRECGIVGTTGYGWKERNIRAELTTPDPLTLQKILRQMADHGVTHCVMEVSSHALVQKRVLGCGFDVMAFTNLSQDHLDYHGSMEEYFRAKRELFLNPSYRREDAVAVINMDDEWGRGLLEDTEDSVAYSIKSSDADVYPVEYSLKRDGIRAVVESPQGRVRIRSSLVGEHNLQNILAALSVAEALGISTEAIEEGIATLKGVPGRLEAVSTTDDIYAYVDYAHTPDALERVCRVLRNFTEGRLITVFGCGGNRDRAKRPLMAKAVAEYSHVAIVTSDNPRDEDPMKIIEDIEVGLRGIEKCKPEDLPAERCYMVVPDRKEAIGLAVKIARPHDTILVAGKGHEDYQIIGGRRLHFDDREVLKEAISERAASTGAEKRNAYNS